jgi:hypothetical protein
MPLKKSSHFGQLVTSLGSAKLSGMAGHSVLHGDWFSLVQGAYSSKRSGAKPLYYPISPPQKDEYNKTHPTAHLNHLPRQGQRHYWDTIKRLESAATSQEHGKIVKSTGISHLTVCAASLAFLHPSFYPLDPFHLFYENCMV